MNLFVYLWLSLLLAFLIVEGASVALISIWFALGALAAAVAALLGASFGVQVVLFLAVCVVLLVLLRPIVGKYFTPRLQKTNVDSLIGQECPVTADICNLRSQGQVKIGGMTWSARSVDDSDIPVDSIVKVERVEGVKLMVSPVSVPVKP